MSYSDDKTEKQLKTLERKISKAFKDAYEGINADATKYFASLESRWEKEHEAFLAGEYTEAEFKAWEQTQLARGKKWEKVKSDMARQLTQTNEIASSYINDTTPSIYSLNANYEAYQIAQDSGSMQSAWDMVDQQTVKQLIESKQGKYTEFKTTRVNPQRDYEWNSQQIQRTLNAGILQGNSIGELADAFESVMKRNRSSAIRNARTSVTSAQNAGRLKSLEQAEKLGIKVQKKWVSTLDERTRFSHAMLNGQIREISKEFSNGLMHPADSLGSPREVYNCRCTLTYIYPDYDKQTSNELWEEMSVEEKAQERKRYEKWQSEMASIHKSQQKDFKFKRG